MTLSPKDLTTIEAFAKSCRSSILEMTTNAASGHPGGSLSCIDYLSVLYTQFITKTGEEVIVSNGHVSPAVYATLAECGYIPKADLIKTFRQKNSKYEGHVARTVKGVHYGTGPLGVGVSAANGFAIANPKQKVYVLMGDGEMQEGQVYEAINFANRHKLNNLVAFVDYNKVQLTASLKEIFKTNPIEIFQAAGWHTIVIDGHNYEQIARAINKANKDISKPVAIIGHTIMGKGVEFMEQEGRELRSTWHGKAASKEEIAPALKELKLSPKEKSLLTAFRSKIKFKPKANRTPAQLATNKIDTGTPVLYTELTDCRSAYGAALLDLSKRNSNIVTFTADLRGSVKTDGVANELPEQYYECGIAEQNMISTAGGLSLADSHISFASTFGAFMTSRAKDQCRVNDINRTNLKMVATHCGLSVGEDGPTHQAIDDINSLLGLFNTMIVEGIDPNHTDRVIRYIASHFGNFYVRLGRHKYPVITKTDGKPFYDKRYKFIYGKCDRIREGKKLTIAATGPMVHEALEAIKDLPKNQVELIAVSSVKEFDKTLKDSIKKTGRLLTIEDHNLISGLSSQIAKYVLKENLPLKKFENLGVPEYQLSGKAADLYDLVGISAKKITKKVKQML